MKTLVKSILIVAVLGLFSASTFASDLLQRDTIVSDTTEVETLLLAFNSPLFMNDTVVVDTTEVETIFLALNDKDTYKEVNVSEVPEAVVEAAMAKYEGYTIDKAMKCDGDTYKLLLTKDEEKLFAIYDEVGNFLKEKECTKCCEKEQEA